MIYILLGVLVLVAVYVTLTNQKHVETFSDKKEDQKSEEESIVWDAFNDILKRNPNSDELKYFSKKLKSNKLDRLKLENLLESTPEYRRYAKTQDNQANADLIANNSERRVKFIIVEKYRKIFGITPSPETIAFLLQKYGQVGYDDEMFEKYLKKMKKAENEDDEDNFIKPHDEIKYKYQTYEKTKKHRKPQDDCGAYESTLLSDEIDRRNTDELYAQCKRYDDLVLLPDQAWSVPQKRAPVCIPTERNNVSPSIDQTALIGTLLDDAKNTGVGSLIAAFKYEEEENKKCKVKKNNNKR